MPDAPNRRHHRRLPAHLLPSLTARLSGGSAVRLLDVSRRGVRLETSMHMRPGQTVCIRFVAADATVTLSAAVVRASVAHLQADGVRYETALSLAGDLLLCDQLHDAAHQPADAGVEASTATDDALAAVVDYTVVVQGSPDVPTLLHGLQANSW
ncbi:hypothetical protein TBR22_A05370 [Luteitalea sp. TBR-22]|uniref:PilZ domain-containing protein n=1 Tax=Luteitalea sp. TBR-22 TaxID=2802971 RepID=UPI001AFA31C3|nr:PilZ domain-containing protein [Luteitalea sp. TBR-22]BCS31337.1 hypothetical protein TBR22_A05370 [Luteitalea sp. TBR-22]